MTEPLQLPALLTGLPAAPRISVEQLQAAVARAHRVVVLDDDPTGTQTVADVPIVTDWQEADLRWALAQGPPGFYVLTNTRSLGPAQAAARARAVLGALARTAAELRIELSVISRGDSTLRGHFPLETDVLTDGYPDRLGRSVDAVLLIPAYVDAGRITVNSCHWVRTPDGFIPAGRSEFAADPTFGYAASDLREFVAEKTLGRWRTDDVDTITLADLRLSDTTRLAQRLAQHEHAHPVVVDAACDQDLRVITLASIEAERAGTTLLYRTGPSFVRSRLGQDRRPPLSDSALAAMMRPHQTSPPRPVMPGGLIVAGSFVDLATRQLAALADLDDIVEIELDVEALLSSREPGHLIAQIAAETVSGLRQGDVVLRTSRRLIGDTNPEQSLATQERVSSALVAIVSAVIEAVAPRWIVAKGGITSSDLATRALGIRRAWVRGTLLDGVVSLWQPDCDPVLDVPYVVFAGNVGDDGSLVEVTRRLRKAAS